MSFNSSHPGQDGDENYRIAGDPMAKLIRVRYNRKAIEEAYRKALPLPEPESREIIGEASLDEADLNAVAKIFYERMKAEEQTASGEEEAS